MNIHRLAGLWLVFACAASSVFAQAPRPGERFLEDHENPAVIRFRGVVAVPFETAYLNLLRQAQSCWASPPGAQGPERVIDNDVNLISREGVITVTHPAMGAGTALVSVRLHGDGINTYINAAAMKSTPGAPHLGSPDLHSLDKWAMGEHTRCSTPM